MGGGAPHHSADPWVCLCPPAPLQAAVKHLLPEIKPQDASKLCVVIDLDETLVHSSFKVGDALAHPPPPAPCSVLLPSDAQCHGSCDRHSAQPRWDGWGVLTGGGGSSRGCGQRAGSVWAGVICPALILLCRPQPVNNADFIIPVEIDGIMHQVMRGYLGGGGTATSSPGTSSCPSTLHQGAFRCIRVLGLALCRGRSGCSFSQRVGR